MQLHHVDISHMLDRLTRGQSPASTKMRPYTLCIPNNTHTCQFYISSSCMDQNPHSTAEWPGPFVSVSIWKWKLLRTPVSVRLSYEPEGLALNVWFTHIYPLPNTITIPYLLMQRLFRPLIASRLARPSSESTALVSPHTS